jgi:hypothetical protein
MCYWHDVTRWLNCYSSSAKKSTTTVKVDKKQAVTAVTEYQSCLLFAQKEDAVLVHPFVRFPRGAADCAIRAMPLLLRRQIAL